MYTHFLGFNLGLFLFFFRHQHISELQYFALDALSSTSNQNLNKIIKWGTKPSFDMLNYFFRSQSGKRTYRWQNFNGWCKQDSFTLCFMQNGWSSPVLFGDSEQYPSKYLKERIKSERSPGGQHLWIAFAKFKIGKTAENHRSWPDHLDHPSGWYGRVSEKSASHHW